jgi:hypothetical protein
MTLTTSSKSFEIKEIGTWVYLLKDNKLFSGEITEVMITQFSDNFGNMKVGIKYKIVDNWYFANTVFNDVDAVMEHLKSNCQMIA